MGCAVDSPALEPSADTARSLSPAASQQRVLQILSYVWLAIHEQAATSVERATEWDPSALLMWLDEANRLLNDFNGPNDMARCLVSTLKAYFLLLSGDCRGAVAIVEPLADLVSDNPLVLHLPVVWTAVLCVRTLLAEEARVVAVDRLKSAMEPLAPRLATMCEGCLVGRELMCVFKEGRAASRAPSRPGGRAGLLLRQK